MQLNAIQYSSMQTNAAQYSSMQFDFFGNMKHIKSSTQINAHSSFSLFPSNEQIGEIFDVAVFGLERKPQGITLKYFSPIPASKKRR